MNSIPSGLIESIKQGRCIAFIGAGFSVPCKLPTWANLLSKIVDRVENENLLNTPDAQELLIFLREKIEHASKTGNAEIYDLVAQLLEDNLTVEVVEKLVRDELKTSTDIPGPMRKRLKLLDSLPFKAIVTTNFDMLLTGPTPWSNPEGRPPYEEVLRTSNSTNKYSRDEIVESHLRGENIDSENATESTETDAGLFNCSNLCYTKYRPIIKLHGTIAANGSINQKDLILSDDIVDRALVWTRSGYRKLLHQTPGYALFLKTLLATSTVLYLGFSFSDYYLNDVRSEVLSMLYGDLTEKRNLHKMSPIGYAIVNDKTKYETELFKKHEGVEMLTWSTKTLGYGVFDEYLEKIHHLTSYAFHLGSKLQNKRILLVETKPAVQEGVEAKPDYSLLVPVIKRSVIDYFETLGGENTVENIITHAGTAGEAIEYLSQVGREEISPFDAIVTVFGEDQTVSNPREGKHTWKLVVDGMRELPERAQTPFIVYASTWNEDNRRNVCIRYGAFDFLTSFSQLVDTLTTLFSKEESLLIGENDGPEYI